MPEPTQPEHGTEQSTSTELPIPKLETPSPASPSSVDTDAIVKQVAEQLRREIKQAQSTKDKEISAIKQKLGISDLSELEAMGAQIPDNVKLEYRLRQIESQRSPESTTVQQPPSSGSGAALTAQDVSEVVKKYQLDANDAGVIEVLRGTYRNHDHFEATLANIALARVNKPQPSAAESATIQANPPGAGKSVEALTDDYKQEMLAARGKPGLLKEIKNKYAQKGVNIHQVDFT